MENLKRSAEKIKRDIICSNCGDLPVPEKNRPQLYTSVIVLISLVILIIIFNGYDIFSFFQKLDVVLTVVFVLVCIGAIFVIMLLFFIKNEKIIIH